MLVNDHLTPQPNVCNTILNYQNQTQDKNMNKTDFNSICVIDNAIYHIH